MRKGRHLEDFRILGDQPKGGKVLSHWGRDKGRSRDLHLPFGAPIACDPELRACGDPLGLFVPKIP